MSAQEDTIFGKIIRKEIPADIVYETETVLAFRDISPIAPKHIILIPKKLIKSLSTASGEDAGLLGELLIAAAEIARQQGLDQSGYRVVTNVGKDGGQSVFHLHFHIIGGRHLEWPPG